MKEKEDSEVFCYEPEEGVICLEFSEAAVSMEIYEQEFGGLEFYRLIHSLSHRDEVLSSPTIG